MGNSYLALNRKEEAVSFFNKALLRIPMYEESKKRLKELRDKKCKG